MTTLDNIIFDTYICAYEHAQKNSRCAHVACGIIVNGKLKLIASNTSSTHAECEALQRWEKVFQKDWKG